MSGCRAEDGPAIFLDVERDNDEILLTPLPNDYQLTDFQASGDSRMESHSTIPPKKLINKDQERHFQHRHRYHPPHGGSDLRVIIPTKAERIAKLKRVDSWLDEVIKNEDELETKADETGLFG